MIILDEKIDALDAQARIKNVIIDGIPEDESEKLQDSECWLYLKKIWIWIPKI